MGLDDREYMKARYRARQGIRWNDRKSRVEYDEADVLAARYRARTRRPRSATIDRAFDFRWIATFGLALGFSALGWKLMTGGEGDRAFPASGSVTIAADLKPESARGRFRIRAGHNNAVIQLLNPAGNHVISIYMRAYDERVVPVPEGRFSLRIAEGRRWTGIGQFFGAGTIYRRGDRAFVFTARGGHYLVLETPDGNLHMKPEYYGVPRP